MEGPDQLMFTSGVHYCREWEAKSPYTPDAAGMHRYEYTWVHIPSKGQGARAVFCKNKTDFLTLLNYWNNCEDWKYMAKPGDLAY